MADLISRDKIDAYLKKYNTTEDKLVSAVQKKYGPESTEYKKISASLAAGPVVSANPTVTAPVAPVAAAPVLPSTVGGSFGNVSSDNVHASNFEDTGVAYAKNQNDLAEKTAAISKEEGDAKKAMLEQRDADKKARAAIQEGRLKNIEGEFDTNAAARRGDADKLFKRQDEIAARNANMAAAQAGASGVQLSQGAMDDVKNDIMAKYGSNIANAEQFRLETNKSIDQALRDTGLAIFDKQGAIDTFKNALLDAEFEPVLNALTAAALGKKEAAKDIADYYKKYIDKKAEEEYTRVAASETRAAKDKEWASATKDQKYALIRQYGGDTYASNMDAFNKLITDYPDDTQQQILDKMAKIIEDKGNGNAILALYEQRADRSKTDPLMEALKTKMLNVAIRGENQTDTTVEQTNANADKAAQVVAAGNPNKYTNADNLAFYNSLSPDQKKRFDDAFRAQEPLADRQEQFNRAKVLMNKGNVNTGPSTLSPSVVAKLDQLKKDGKAVQAVRQLTTELNATTDITKQTQLRNSIAYLNQA